MNRYTNTRPDTHHLGSEYQTAASYLRRGSKLALGTNDRGARTLASVQTGDDIQQTGGDAVPNKDPQNGNA